MATAKVLRCLILSCAAEAAAADPTNIDRRARNFIARLSGAMEFHKEHELEQALWEQLLGQGADEAEGQPVRTLPQNAPGAHGAP